MHRIAGSSGNEVGGLIIKKKPASQEADGDKKSKWDRKPAEFKAPTPRASMFGLDVLAKRKREEKEAKEEGKFGEKRVKVVNASSGASARQGSGDDDYQFSDDGARVSFGRSTEKQKDRLYRQSRVETPSHPGGVNAEVMGRIQQRMRRDRPFAVGAKSRDTDRGHRSIHFFPFFSIYKCTCAYTCTCTLYMSVITYMYSDITLCTKTHLCMPMHIHTLSRPFCTCILKRLRPMVDETTVELACHFLSLSHTHAHICIMCVQRRERQ